VTAHGMAGVLEVLGKRSSFLVATHRNPDGDAIGSALALRHLLEGRGARVTVWVPEGVPPMYRFMRGAADVLRELPACAAWEATVVVDCADEGLLARPLPPPAQRGTVVVVDHHPNRREWGDVFFFAEAAATGQIVYDLAGALGGEMTKDFAECVYTAILTDTGSFRYSSTTPEVLRIAARCVERGALPWKAAWNVYEKHPAGRIHLLVEVLSTLKLELGGRFASMTSDGEALARHGLGPDALEDFINYGRGIAGVEVAALVRRREDGFVRVSLRSVGRVDVGRAAGAFGGGGHRNAAGCTFPPERTLDEVRVILRDHFERTERLSSLPADPGDDAVFSAV